MSKLTMLLSSVVLIGAVVVWSGCGKSADAPAQTEPASPGAAEADNHPGHEHGDQQPQPGDDQQASHSQHAPPAELAQYTEVLGELPMEDRMAVYQQKLCPVTGHPLGMMGKPYKLTVNDRELFLCCPGCEAKITADPDTYLAKLAK